MIGFKSFQNVRVVQPGFGSSGRRDELVDLTAESGFKPAKNGSNHWNRLNLQFNGVGPFANVCH
jgi:hypothetical protein